MVLRAKISNDFSLSDLDFFLKSQEAYRKAGIAIEYVDSKEDVIIYKTDKKKMFKLYPEMGDSGLSLTDRERKPYKIHLSKENWKRVPEHLGSEYEDLQSYRIALISHEIAHALGHDHVHCACVGCPADVRQQPSRHLHGCKPTTKVIFNAKSPFTADNF
jgi:hypothetical protein